jgi:tRNA(His) 5'-end guanylyltransferase
LEKCLIKENYYFFYQNPPCDEKFNCLKIFGAKLIKITNNGTLIVYSHSGELSSITKVSIPVDWIIKVVSLDKIMGKLLPPELIRIIAGFL